MNLPKLLLPVGRFIYGLVKPIEKAIAFTFIKIYKLLLPLQRAIVHVVSLKSNKIWKYLSNRYVYHVIIVVLAVIVVNSNLSSYALAEEFGRDTIMFQLLGEHEELIEDYSSPSAPSKNIQASDVSAVAAIPTVVSDDVAADLLDATDIDPSTVVGDSALLKPELASTQASKGKNRDRIISHEVDEGETIGQIAELYEISVNTILWANGLTSRSLIRPGDKLVILPTSGVSHTIKPGDTILQLAKKYGGDTEKIITTNKLADASDIQVGDVLVIPNGQPQAAPRPRYTPPVQPTPIKSYANLKSPSAGMVWPTSCRRITQYFGWRHTGLDIACGWNKPIYASEAGVVSRVQYARYGYGYNVMINHGGGKQTLYAHFAKIYVKNGQAISKGQVIGEMGSTGRSTGPHLHFEVRLGGRYVNPLGYVK